MRKLREKESSVRDDQVKNKEFTKNVINGEKKCLNYN